MTVGKYTQPEYYMPSNPADGMGYKKFKNKKKMKLMGLKPIRFVHGYRFRTKAKMWFQLKDDLLFDFTLM